MRRFAKTERPQTVLEAGSGSKMAAKKRAFDFLDRSASYNVKNRHFFGLTQMGKLTFSSEAQLSAHTSHSNKVSKSDPSIA